MTQIFFDGDGTEANPYEIGSADDLKKFADAVNRGNDFTVKFFVLTADIDLSGNWTPIGSTESTPFKSTFDGCGHTISNLTIDNPSCDCLGLFGYVVKGTIKNLNLSNVNINGKDRVGGLVGYNSGKVENCTVSGATVSGKDRVGGLVGYNDDGTVENCTVSGATVSGKNSVGGLVGEWGGGTVENCTVSNANVSGNENVGGLVGENNRRSKVNNCTVSNANVNGQNHVGGLVGGNSGKVWNCTVSGATVKGNDSVGGLVGEWGGGTVENCTVSNANVSGNENVGGLVGYNGGTVTDCTVSGATVSGKKNVGGLVGDNWEGTVENCTVSDTTVSGKNSVGGLIGFSSSGTVDDCTVSNATVSGKNSFDIFIGRNDGFYSNGNGTESNPYKINSADDLKQLAHAVNLGNDFKDEFFVLTADIELSGNWTPIGYHINDDEKPFSGTFDGQGHTIKNLTIDNPSCDCQGLFGFVGKGGTIKNLKLTNVNINGKDRVGGLVGYNSGKVENCTVSDTKVAGNDSVGGLVGYNDDTVTDCTVSGTNYYHGDRVKAVDKYQGKLSGTVTRVYSITFPDGVTVTGGLELGGNTFFASGTTITVSNFAGEEISFDDALTNFMKDGDNLLVSDGENEPLTISGLPSSVAEKFLKD